MNDKTRVACSGHPQYECLETQYTLSIAEACKILRCSREWIARYIRPNVKSIYLDRPSAYRTVTETEKETKEQNCRKQVWFDRADFEQFVLSHMTCTRQTIIIPMNWLLKETDWEFEPNINYKFNNDDFTKIGLQVYRRSFDANKLIRRNDVPHIKVSIPEHALKEMCTVEECKKAVTVFNMVNPKSKSKDSEKPVSNEAVYRYLFRLGYFRLELQIPDKGKKIYYLRPKSDASNAYPVLIRYDDYCKYFLDKSCHIQ